MWSLTVVIIYISLRTNCVEHYFRFCFLFIFCHLPMFFAKKPVQIFTHFQKLGYLFSCCWAVTALILVITSPLLSRCLMSILFQCMVFIFLKLFIHKVKDIHFHGVEFAIFLFVIPVLGSHLIDLYVSFKNQRWEKEGLYCTQRERN